ncbi:MAG: phosphate ABC transporter substrate-binding protein [Planctomycetia bacterium]|nr:phosphate ABC transporter substrate-binding protein [Planctomycetia bacterium]
MKKLVMALVVAVPAFTAGCGKSGDPNHLTVAGSTAFADVAKKEADAFKKTRAAANIEVQSTGSMVGIKNLADGVCDIAMADLPDVPSEAKDFKSFVVAKDGLAVIVHPKNPVASLTVEQVGKIFSGATTNWKDLGGEDAEITVVVREENSGGRKAFDKECGITGKVSGKAQSQTSSGALRTSVASNPHAIGYVATVKVDSTVKAVHIGGVAPTTENVIAGKYPLFVTVYLFTKGEPAGLAKDYIEYTLSPEGQKVIKDSGMIPVK